MNFYCNEQLSGFSELRIYLLSETSNWPKVLTDQTAGQIIFNPEVHSVDGEIDDDSINIEVSEKRKDLYDISASFSFINRGEAMDQMLDQYKNKPCVIVGCLNNAYQKLYGSNQQPLILSFRVDDGSKIDDKGATFVNIKGSTRKRPVYFTSVESE